MAFKPLRHENMILLKESSLHLMYPRKNKQEPERSRHGEAPTAETPQIRALLPAGTEGLTQLFGLTQPRHGLGFGQAAFATHATVGIKALKLPNAAPMVNANPGCSATLPPAPQICRSNWAGWEARIRAAPSYRGCLAISNG